MDGGRHGRRGYREGLFKFRGLLLVVLALEFLLEFGGLLLLLLVDLWLWLFPSEEAPSFLPLVDDEDGQNALRTDLQKPFEGPSLSDRRFLFFPADVCSRDKRRRRKGRRHQTIQDVWREKRAGRKGCTLLLPL